MVDFETGLNEMVAAGDMPQEMADELMAIEAYADDNSFEMPYGDEPWSEPQGTPITVEDFKGTGLGPAAIKRLANDDIETVEALRDLGKDGINELRGVSDAETEKIWARIRELLSG